MLVGLDRLPRTDALVKRLRAERVGVLAHAASVDAKLRHVSTVLENLGVRPAVLFGPEHGWGGEAQDMIGVASARDAQTGARIVSLYGETFADLSPKSSDLAEIDVLLVDLTDVGARYYTFVWTALLALRAAHRAGVATIVLDRPNPLGGVRIEGATQRQGYLSFVGLEAVPIRHALSLGEMLSLFASREGLPLGDGHALSVLSVSGWDRDHPADAWDRPFVMPSPNMPTADTALVYPGGCLVEGTNLSEGRGTTRPFELVGAPWLDGSFLARDLMALGLPGFIARSVTFRPTFQKHAGLVCGGVQVHVTDPSTFRPVATYTALIALAHRLDPVRFRFRTERYEYVDDIPAFDLLLGSPDARHGIMGGDDVREIAEAASHTSPEASGIVAEARAAMSLADPVMGF